MSRVKVSVRIDAPRREVWRAIEDVRRHVDWMEDAVAIRVTSPRRTGTGTTFECDTKVGPLRTRDVMAITEWRAGRSMGVRHDGVVTGEGRFTLRRARGVATRFSWQEQLRFPWWMGGPVGAALATPVLQRIWRRNLTNLKRLVEDGERGR